MSADTELMYIPEARVAELKIASDNPLELPGTELVIGICASLDSGPNITLLIRGPELTTALGKQRISTVSTSRPDKAKLAEFLRNALTIVEGT